MSNEEFLAQKTEQFEKNTNERKIKLNCAIIKLKAKKEEKEHKKDLEEAEKLLDSI